MKVRFMLMIFALVALPLILNAKPIMVKLLMLEGDKTYKMSSVYIDEANYGIFMDASYKKYSLLLLDGKAYAIDEAKKTYQMLKDVQELESLLKDQDFGNLSELIQELDLKSFRKSQKMSKHPIYGKVEDYFGKADASTEIILTFSKSTSLKVFIKNWDKIPVLLIRDWGKRLICDLTGYGVVVEMKDPQEQHIVKILMTKPDFNFRDYLKNYKAVQ